MEHLQVKQPGHAQKPAFEKPVTPSSPSYIIATLSFTMFLSLGEDDIDILLRVQLSPAKPAL